MGPMTIARTISTEAEWDALPVGTLARVGYLGDDEDENDQDGIMSILRVDGDFRANAGDCMLAGGKYWAEVWVWQQGVTVFDPTVLPEPDFETPDPSLDDAVAAVDAAIKDHARRIKDFGNTPVRDYFNLPSESHPDRNPARAIVEALQARGWAPAPVYPDGVQVWTISGIPAEEPRSDGTMAYLSLPAGDPDKQIRSDIWLENPTVTVNFEFPARRIN